MLIWKEFSAWISIDGTEAAEYGIETSEDEKTVTCWIASELGKKFSVNWTNASFYETTSGLVDMDGHQCQGKVIYGHPGTLPQTASKQGILDGLTVKPFVFSSLELTDDDAFLGEDSSHQELGVIKLVIAPIRITQLNVPPSGRSPSDIKVHERSKKAVTQQITVGNSEMLAQPAVFASSERTGPDLVTFFFKYRPIDVLRANGIAPPPPQLKRKSPDSQPERAPTPDDDLTDAAYAEEARILRERLAADQARLAALETKRIKKGEKKLRIKAESGPIIDLTQDTRRAKKVKLEPSQPFVSGEIIDLT
ncbi:hypothetical protein C8R44DRAFT_866887 [Mycena epipterygia]|nr:hypothetical protein C8R44DRAFT_866887 [Mycena epipterygia]